MNMKKLVFFTMLISVMYISGCKKYISSEIQTATNPPIEILEETEPKTTEASNMDKISFTEEEIADAKAVIEKYFEGKNEKNVEKIVKSCHPSRLTMEDVESGRTILFGDEEITLLTIHEYDYDFQKRFNPSALMKFSEGNVIVFTLDYEVSFPNGSADNSPYDEGICNGWAIVLVRDDANSPWLIYDQGY